MNPRQTPPSGTVTLMFTDIVKSTRAKEKMTDDSYGDSVMMPHNARLRVCLAEHNAYEVKTIGDSFFAAFDIPREACACAAAIHRAITHQPISTPYGNLQVRIGLHTGTPQLIEESGRPDYMGTDVDKCARIEALAGTGQILVSAECCALVHSTDLHFVDWGLYRLKDLSGMHRIFGLDWDTSETARRPPGARFLALEGIENLKRFIGRERERDEVVDLVLQHRLVTLHGFGGIGKTRLALEAAFRLSDEFVSEQFASGAAFVELADVEDNSETVARIVLRTLGKTEQDIPPNTSPSEYLVETLKPLRLLLVLDNFESVPSANVLIGKLLLGDKPLRVLVTSRTPVGIAHVEKLYGVQPLVVPSFKAGAMSRNELDAVESFRLLRERIRLNEGMEKWEPSESEIPHVAEVLGLTDGIPLAIELFAAQMEGYSWSRAARELRQCRLEILRLVEGHIALDHERHSSLRASLDWSYERLNPEAQTLFARLAVFRGSFTIEAAARATVTDQAGRLLRSLARAAFVRHDRERDRFTLLPLVQEYAFECLGTEADSYRERHCDYFCEFVKPSREKEYWELGKADFDATEAELHNILAAIDWARKRGDSSAVLTFACSVSRFFWIRGHWHDGRKCLTWGVQAAEQLGERAIQARLCRELGMLAENQGDFAKALESYECSRRLAEALGEYRELSETLREIGWTFEREGDYVEAVRLYQQSLELSGQARYKRGVASAQHMLGRVAQARSDFTKARSLHESNLSIWKELSDKEGEAASLHMLGIVCLEEQKYGEAQQMLEKSLIIKEAIGYERGKGATLCTLGRVSLGQQDYVKARKLFQRSLEICVTLGDKSWQASSLCYLGVVERLNGDLSNAVMYWQQALELLEALHSSEADQVRRWMLEAEREPRSAVGGQRDGGVAMADDNDVTPKPVPFSGYIDLVLSVLFPLLGVSFALLVVFWVAIRPSVSETAIASWVVGIAAIGLVVGILNAVRYYRKPYRR